MRLFKKYTVWIVIASLLFPFPLTAEENTPPGADPNLLQQIKTLREEWREDLGVYKDKIQKAMDDLKDAMEGIQERLIKEDLTKKEREELFKEYEEAEKLRRDLDDEEDTLQAATIVLWAKRKKKLEQFFKPD